MEAEPSRAVPVPAADQLAVGFLLGILVGEGHFGGDGRQPQVTLRMNVRHEGTFRWIERVFPGGRLFGPYHHDGRHYFQWMARGPFLRDRIAPLVHRHRHLLDDHVAARFDAMCQRYAISLDSDAAPGEPATLGSATAPEARSLPAAAEAD